MASERPLEIAIVGAGLAGVTLALGLTRNNPNLNLTVFESRRKFSEISNGVGFGSNAVRAMSLITPKIVGIEGVYESVKTPNLDPPKRDIWYDVRHGDGPKAGTLIQEVRGEANFEFCSLSRAKFLEGIVGLLDPRVKLNFGTRIIDIVDGIDNHVGQSRLRFEDGTEAYADAVIGCDGIRSKVRELMFGEKANAVYSGKYAYRKVVSMKKAIATVGPQMRNRQMFVGKGGHVVTQPIKNGDALNIVAFRDARGEAWKRRVWVVPSDREAMLKDYEGWGEEVVKILELIEYPEKWGLFDTTPAETYTVNNLCILGDAAHATSPHLDSGAGFAIEDAYLLSGLLKPELVKTAADIKYAFKAWDAVRRPRCNELISRSREQGLLLDLQAQDGEEVSAEDVREKIEIHQRWVWDVDLEGMLEKATVFFRKEKEAAGLLKC
ncbi:hypothetical protein HYFRA_00008150 [Hymenoscyphus fraxineus]|uniref:FAD-binding domain-containing protein n=1 Tax=Hymenoscyphus fraxineus TaxID=746836 RepID=A0A9N9L5G4_9HELO|nr:hypothetical protein HYFRA_00008150 [Hymenoscyphus fraxineus]